MSNYNSFILPPIQTKTNENNCLEQYYRYIVGMSMNQQPPSTENEYQKIYVDTLVGKYMY